MDRDNVSGAANQQERLDAYLAERILRDHMPNAASNRGEEMVRPAWRHAEPGRNGLALTDGQTLSVGVTTVSVPIRCRRRRLEEGCP